MNEKIVEIEYLIESKYDDLKKYKQKPDANSFVIDKMEKEISKLLSILEFLSKFKNIDFWCNIDDQIKNVITQDAEIGSFILFIDLDNGKKQPGNIYKTYPTA